MEGLLRGVRDHSCVAVAPQPPSQGVADKIGVHLGVLPETRSAGRVHGEHGAAVHDARIQRGRVAGGRGGRRYPHALECNRITIRKIAKDVAMSHCTKTSLMILGGWEMYPYRDACMETMKFPVESC